MLPQAESPVETPTSPNIRPPANACDTHVHMVGGPDDFPLWEGRVENPASGSFETWLERYRQHLDVLGFSRGVIVHSILYGDDNSITAATVKALGAERFRGIGLVRDEANDVALDKLVSQSMAGIRLNYVHGGVLSFDGVLSMAPRLQERGLHLQMLVNAHKHMQDVASGVRALSIPVVFDHIAWPDLSL
ncbi:MAG: amidohydrolase family protein, partial [Hyphomicrobiales bacterium]